MTRSMDAFATLLLIYAVTPVGREPITKVGEPAMVPAYLTSGIWPRAGVASAMLTVTVPLAVNPPLTLILSGATVGLPKLSRSKLRLLTGPTRVTLGTVN